MPKNPKGGNRKLLLTVVAGFACLLALVALPIVIIVVLFGGASIQANCAPAGGMPILTPAAGEGKVRVAQANIKVSMSDQAFRKDLATVVATNPDFISLNEVSRRSHSDLTPRGFAMHRAKQPARGDDGTAVLWNTKRWTKSDQGRTMLVASGPQAWDYDRAATWVTLTGEDVGEVSMISTHQMINPAKYGPNKPKRQRIYRKGMKKLQALVRTLSSRGPVFVAGDFNSQFSANDPWGPRAMLRPVGLRSTMESLGKKSTHNAGGIIDYIFFQPQVARASKQIVQNLGSDHHLLRADFDLGRNGREPASNTPKKKGKVAQPASRTQQQATSMQPAVQEASAGNAQQQLMELRLAEDYPTLSAEQARNAVTIAQVARALKVPRHGLEVAIATAIQESKLENLIGGDRDSGGLFQQRPSQGWGTRAQVTNPRLAAQAFFGRARHTDNSGLLDIPGWQDLPLTEAAQKVQGSGHPDLYAQWEDVAEKIAAILGGDLAETVSAQNDCRPLKSGTQCQPVATAAEKGLTADARLVLRKIDARFGSHTYGGVGQRSGNPRSDHPAGRAVDVMIKNWHSRKGMRHGNRIAEWVRSQAQELGVTYVIWRGRIWNTGDKSWSSYAHPSGAADATSMHMDHVHISVKGGEATATCTAGTGKVVWPIPLLHVGSDSHNWHEGGSSWSSWHTGTDFGVPCGTPVFAAHGGRIEIDRSQGWSGPWLVKVVTGPKSLATWYAHMQALTVTDGQVVKPGQQIGEAGDRGNSRGCHLHFEVHERNGSIYGPDNINPSDWLSRNVGSEAA